MSTIRKRLSTAQYANMLYDYQNFMNVQDIADKYGVHQQTVIRHVKKNGLPAPRERAVDIRDFTNQVIVDRLKDGEPIAEIAESLGVGEGRVRLLAAENGMSMAERHEKIRIAWKAGHTKEAIARAVGVSYDTVHRVIKKMGQDNER